MKSLILALSTGFEARTGQGIRFDAETASVAGALRSAVGKFTVADLKGWMQGKGIKAGTKKAEIVDAVNGWHETKMETD